MKNQLYTILGLLVAMTSTMYGAQAAVVVDGPAVSNDAPTCKCDLQCQAKNHPIRPELKRAIDLLLEQHKQRMRGLSAQQPSQQGVATVATTSQPSLPVTAAATLMQPVVSPTELSTSTVEQPTTSGVSTGKALLATGAVALGCYVALKNKEVLKKTTTQLAEKAVTAVQQHCEIS